MKFIILKSMALTGLVLGMTGVSTAASTIYQAAGSLAPPPSFLEDDRGGAVLERTEDGIRLELSIHTLSDTNSGPMIPDNFGDEWYVVYSVDWIIFNKPQNCDNFALEGFCKPSQPNVGSGMAVVNAGGGITDADANLNLEFTLPKGTGEKFGVSYNLKNPLTAEVHLVMRPQGGRHFPGGPFVTRIIDQIVAPLNIGPGSVDNHFLFTKP